ncbi:hypothetical protein UA08_06351 [Talaromyces atroroseus]|uniref:Zn(2)-C6 fungal-type domain-containing protein n=1 Tax=Talaromyces atroroseus TaxID=1441469 RepID=A0A225AMI7_TALAT|nr:hypothetical protein UA08_06351 [Talaromyces atroroseus]OKL58478.1 hypothetical protein UA08_06351 [Talaromyces atroroseus]
MPPMTRRSHSKSRHGCSNCKQRRVKCDETRPACLNCVKRHKSCRYEAVAALVWKEENAPPKRSHPASPKNHNDDIFAMLERITASRSIRSVSPVAETVLDLELMMHWCNSTHKIFARNETTAWIWRQLVPQEAFAHKFLLWGILSLSALDLARSKPAEQRSMYLNAAAFYQTQALSLFRLALQEVNALNAKALFSFAGIVAIYGFGSCERLNMTDPIQDLLQVLMLVRGVNQVIACVAPTLFDSEFAPLLQMEDASEPLPPDAEATFTHLHVLNDLIQNGTESHTVHQQAIQSLENMIATLHGGRTTVFFFIIFGAIGVLLHGRGRFFKLSGIFWMTKDAIHCGGLWDRSSLRILQKKNDLE